MIYTDEQIVEALARDAYLAKLAETYDASSLQYIRIGHGDALHIVVLASALRAAQERIKELEAKTVPMDLLRDAIELADKLKDVGQVVSVAAWEYYKPEIAALIQSSFEAWREATPKTVPMDLLMDLAYMAEKGVKESARSFCLRMAEAHGYTVTESAKEV